MWERVSTAPDSERRGFLDLGVSAEGEDCLSSGMTEDRFSSGMREDRFRFSEETSEALEDRARQKPEAFGRVATKSASTRPGEGGGGESDSLDSSSDTAISSFSFSSGRTGFVALPLPVNPSATRLDGTFLRALLGAENLPFFVPVRRGSGRAPSGTCSFSTTETGVVRLVLESAMRSSSGGSMGSGSK